jgi:hypothetical protein
MASPTSCWLYESRFLRAAPVLSLTQVTADALGGPLVFSRSTATRTCSTRCGWSWGVPGVRGRASPILLSPRRPSPSRCSSRRRWQGWSISTEHVQSCDSGSHERALACSLPSGRTDLCFILIITQSLLVNDTPISGTAAIPKQMLVAAQMARLVGQWAISAGRLFDTRLLEALTRGLPFTIKLTHLPFPLSLWARAS